MGPIPEDLIVFLFFGLFVLVQIVRARRRHKARRASAPPAAPVAVDAENPTPEPLPWTPPVVELPRPQPAARNRPVPVARQPDGGRFSRRRLIGDRRSLQDAIVIATVLGPCLAQRPRDRE